MNVEVICYKILLIIIIRSQKKDFLSYNKKDKNEMVGAALQNQNKTCQSVFVEKGIIKKHF